MTKLANDTADRASLRIHEVYRSLQGESSRVGLPCTFVRLSRCNLRCRWCDTPQAFVGGEEVTVEKLVADVLALNTLDVCVTGGEPLLQDHVHALMRALCDAG